MWSVYYSGIVLSTIDFHNSRIVLLCFCFFFVTHTSLHVSSVFYSYSGLVASRLSRDLIPRLKVCFNRFPVLCGEVKLESNRESWGSWLFLLIWLVCSRNVYFAYRCHRVLSLVCRFPPGSTLWVCRFRSTIVEQLFTILFSQSSNVTHSKNTNKFTGWENSLIEFWYKNRIIKVLDWNSEYVN